MGEPLTVATTWLPVIPVFAPAASLKVACASSAFVAGVSKAVERSALPSFSAVAASACSSRNFPHGHARRRGTHHRIVHLARAETLAHWQPESRLQTTSKTIEVRITASQVPFASSRKNECHSAISRRGGQWERGDCRPPKGRSRRSILTVDGGDGPSSTRWPLMSRRVNSGVIEGNVGVITGNRRPLQDCGSRRPIIDARRETGQCGNPPGKWQPNGRRQL